MSEGVASTRTHARSLTLVACREDAEDWRVRVAHSAVTATDRVTAAHAPSLIEYPLLGFACTHLPDRSFSE